MARDWRDGFADFWGQGSEDVAPGRKYKPGSNTAVETDIWDTIWGRSGSELNAAKKTDVADNLETQYKNRLNSLKPGSYVRGSDEGTYLSQLRTLQRADDSTAYEESPAGKAAAHQQGLQTDAMVQQATNSSNQLTLATKQLAQTGQLAADNMKLTQLNLGFDRETASADRNLTLRLGQMQSDLADKRLQYDRETRSMDKRDRAIAQLMSGLGSLGGAFTL